MLRKITLVLSAAAIVAISAAASAHPLTHIPHAVGSGYTPPSRVGRGPQAGGGATPRGCNPHTVIINGFPRVVC